MDANAAKSSRRQTKDTLFKHEMEFNHWKANAALVRWFVNQSAGTIDWLANEGVNVKTSILYLDTSRIKVFSFDQTAQDTTCHSSRTSGYASPVR